ncbi:MAG: SDR family oxidoreductase [Bradymonadia bacterium]
MTRATAGGTPLGMKASQVYRPELLRDQVVIVTGGGSGIGREIAFECGRLGARVAIGGRKPERLAETAADLRAEGIEVFEHTLDIREPEQCEAFTEGVTRQLGPPDVLVNNAGGQFPSPAIDVRPKGWRAVVETNLNGTWFMTQAVGRGLIERRRGRVVNIVANMWRGFPGMAHTGAARAGVVNLTQTLALEWARHGILVNAVAPGVIESSGLDHYGPEIKATLIADAPNHVPLKRIGRVEDVAFAVVYLLSPAGDFVTGETICVDGGQKLWGMAFPP